MKNLKNVNDIKRITLWDAFFYALGFRSNPYLDKAKEIKRKSVDDRIGDSLEATSGLFHDVYNREMACVNE